MVVDQRSFVAMIGAAVGLLCAAMAPASAALLSFDFVTDGFKNGCDVRPVASLCQQTQDGTTLTVTATKNGAAAGVFVTALSGLGVDGAPDGARLGISSVASETLRFAFGPNPIRLREIQVFDFGSGANDTPVSFAVVVDGIGELVLLPLGNVTDAILTLDLTSRTALFNDFIGTTFDILPTTNSENGFFVVQMTVETISIEPGPVQELIEPRPLALLMMSLGLLALLVMVPRARRAVGARR